MKSILTAVLMLTLAGFASAKQKHVYNLTGTVAFESFHSNSEAHITVGGTTYDTYCTSDATSVSCTDSPGIFVATLADGTRTVVNTPYIEPCVFGFCGHFGGSTDDPVLNSKSKTFQYRLATHYTMSGKNTPFFCVMGKDGKEACYEIQLY